MKKTILRATCILASFIAPVISASAETLMAHIPFDFTAGVKAMPAGDYAFSVESGVLIVRGAPPALSTALVAVQADSSMLASPSAGFDKSADARVLSRVTLPGGTSYLVQPSLSHKTRTAKSLAQPEGSVLLTRH